MPVRIDGPGRRAGLLVGQSVAQAAIVASTWTIVIPDTTIYDPASAWRMAQANIIPTVPGWYRFAGSFSLNPPGAGTALLALWCNSAEAMRGLQWTFAASTTLVIPFSFDIPIGLAGSAKLNPSGSAWGTGVAYDVRVFCNTTGASTVNANTAAAGPVNWLSVEYLRDA